MNTIIYVNVSNAGLFSDRGNRTFNHMHRHLSATNGRAMQSTEFPAQYVTTEATPISTFRSDAHIVIIASYMRSGSTLTGDLLQHFPRTFYVYEPLHALHIRTRNEAPLQMLNGTKK